MNSAFDLSLLWSLAAGLILGAGLVFALMRRGGSVNRERAESLTTELEETRLDLESHREEVSKHFAETSDLFRDLTEQYTRLYAHLASGAREFCPDEVPPLGQGLDTPLLVDESPRKDATPEPSESPRKDATPESSESPRKDATPESSESPRKDATPEPPKEQAPVQSAAGDEAAAPAAAERNEDGKLAVDAPVPGAAPPPVRSKPNGGSHLAH